MSSELLIVIVGIFGVIASWVGLEAWRLRWLWKSGYFLIHFGDEHGDVTKVLVRVEDGGSSFTWRDRTLFYTTAAADDTPCVAFGGSLILKKKFLRDFSELH